MKFNGVHFLTFCLKVSGVGGQPLCFMCIQVLAHFIIRIKHPKIIAQMEALQSTPTQRRVQPCYVLLLKIYLRLTSLPKRVQNLKHSRISQVPLLSLCDR